MLSVFASEGAMIEESKLKKWFGYIIKDKSKMAIDSAALVYENGNVAGATNTFNMHGGDFLSVKRAFASTNEETITFNGITYCLKSRNSVQLVCFNGPRYLIISRTYHTFIFATCRSRQSSVQLASWIHKVAGKLRERNT